MNTPIITRAKRCTSLVVSGFIARKPRASIATPAISIATFAILVAAAGTFILISDFANAEWKVDFSRRTQQTRTQDLREPASSELPVDASPNQQQPPGFSNPCSSLATSRKRSSC